MYFFANAMYIPWVGRGILFGVHACVCTMMCCASEGQNVTCGKSVLSFDCIGPENQILISKVGSRHLCPLSHLLGYAFRFYVFAIHVSKHSSRANSTSPIVFKAECL